MTKKTQITVTENNQDVQLENQDVQLKNGNIPIDNLGVDNILENPEMNFIINLVSENPEISWLTWKVYATPEASFKESDKKTIWEKIFPWLSTKDLIEFNRTAIWILCLYWAYNWWDKWYTKFTEAQKVEDLKLTRESFDHLHDYTKKILPSKEDFNAMVIYTIINDLWKIHSIVDQIMIDSSNEFALKNISHESSIDAISHFAVKNNMDKIQKIVEMIRKEVKEANVDHDKVLLNWLEKHPHISPSFNSLLTNFKDTIIAWLRWEFNISQFQQAENLPASLKKLKWMDEKSFDFFALHFIYDLAGAAWHFIQNGSVIIDNPTYKRIFILIDILKRYIKWELTELEAYNLFLEEMAKIFWLENDSKSNYAIVKLGCMIRAKTKEDIENLKETFDALWKNTKAILIEELNKNWVDDWFASLIYYAPALLVNLQTKIWKKEWLSLWLTTLARIFQEARIELKNREWNWVYTVLASEVANMASTNPTWLVNNNIVLNNVWDDAKISLKEVPNIDTSKFSQINELSEVPWKTILTIWIWWWSDWVQAGLLSKLLEKSGKKTPAVVSIRTDITSSQWSDWKVWENRTPKNADEIYDWIYLIKKDTEMKWRSLEPIIAWDIPTYLILIKDNVDLVKQIEFLLNYIGNIDTVIWVDTWWDALYSTNNNLDTSKATPDQDIKVLKAIGDITWVKNKLTAEIALWVDTPENWEDILIKANAWYYELDHLQINDTLNQYKEWWIDWNDDYKYWKTCYAWQIALEWKEWIQEIPLPTRVVIDKNNPWNTFVHIQEATKWIFFMTTNAHLKAIWMEK